MAKNPFLDAVIADAQRGGAAGAPGPRPGRQRNPFLEAASGDAAGNPFLAAATPTPEVEAATPNIEPISFWDELGDAYTPDWPTLPPTTLPVPLGAPPAPMMPPAPPTPAEANQHSLAQAAAADATGAPKPPPTITWPAPPPAFTPPSVVADVARDPMTAAREFGRDLKQAFLPDKPDPVADLVNQPWWGEMSEGAQAELLAQATGGSLQQGEALRQRLQIGRLQTAGQEFLLQAGEGLGNALVGVSDVLPVPRLMEHFTGSNPSEEAGRFILDRAAKARENTTNPLYANDPVVAVAGGLGSTVPYFAAGGVSKLAGLGPKATLAVSGMFGAAQGAGAGKITAEMAEATDAQTRLRMLTGAITGSTEAIPLNRILRRFDVASGGLFTRNLKRYVGRPAAEAVESMVEEALQEIVQTYGDAAADEFILGLERDFAQDAVKGGAVGGAVGLILGTASSTARNRTVRRRAQRIEQGREARAVDQYVQRRFEQAPTGAGERVMDQAPPSMRRGAMPVTPEPRPAIDPDATIEAGGVAPAPVIQQAQAAVDAAGPDMAAKQKALDEWKRANPEAVREIEGGDDVDLSKRIAGISHLAPTIEPVIDLYRTGPREKAQLVLEQRLLSQFDRLDGGEGRYPGDEAFNRFVLEMESAIVSAVRSSPLTLGPDGTLAGTPAPRPVEQQRIQAPAGQRTDPPTPGTAPGSTAVASGPAAADSLGKPRVGDVVTVGKRSERWVVQDASGPFALLAREGDAADTVRVRPRALRVVERPQAADEPAAAPPETAQPQRPQSPRETGPVGDNAAARAGVAQARPDDPERSVVNPIDAGATQEEKVRQLAALSEENVPKIESFIARVDRELGTESKYSHKLPDRILAKANRPEIKSRKPWFDVEHVRDSLRFKTVLQSLEDVRRIGQIIAEQGWKIVKLDTGKMLKPKELGWRFVAFDLRMPNGQLVEYYMPLKELEDVKDENHKIFEKWRVTTQEERDARLTEYLADVQESYDRYEGAWNQALSRLGLDANAAEASWKSISAFLESVTRSKLSLRSSTEGMGDWDQAPSTRMAASPRDSSNTSTRSVEGSIEANAIGTSNDIIAENPAKNKENLASEPQIPDGNQAGAGTMDSGEATNEPDLRDTSVSGGARPADGQDVPAGQGPDAEGGPDGDVAGGAVAEPRQPGGDGGVGAVGGEGRAGDREVGEAGPRGADGPAEGDRGARGRSAGPGRGDRPAAADLSPEDRNHVIEPGDTLAPRGDVGKFNANVAAIELVKTLEAERRNATPEEKKVLAQYTGWGWGGELFNEDKPRFAKQRERLQQLLTDDEYRSARASTTNAHYTSPRVIGAMWDMARRLGFDGGTVLEPAAGVGHFFGLMPQDLAGESRMVGIELDSLSARILAKLYPQADVRQQGYQESRIANNSVDLAISNVPFANHPAPGARDYPRLSLHDYFFARTLDKVRPGGLVMFITTQFTMDKLDRRVRRLLSEKADLVGAVRLPNDAFQENAGTEVTTDVVILRKKDAFPFAQAQPWMELTQVGEAVVTEDGKPTAKPIRVNEYFAANPQMALGRHTLEGTMYAAGQYALVSERGQDTTALLAAAVDRLPQGVVGARAYDEAAAAAGGGVAEAGEKEGSYVMRDGQPWRVSDGELVAPDWLTVRNFGDDFEKGITPDQAAQRIEIARDWMSLRAATQALFGAENRETPDAELRKLRRELNAAYDGYVKRWGTLNKRFLHLQKAAFLSDDPDYPFLQSLENEKKTIDTKTGKEVVNYVKGDIFTKRIREPRQMPTTASTVDEAVSIALGYRNTIDLDLIGQLLSIDQEQAKRQVLESGRAFENPQTGLLETREKYLSGSVRKKLLAAEQAAEASPALYARNVEALRAAQPARVSLNEVSVGLGARWLPDPALAAFATELFGTPTTIGYLQAANTYVVRAEDKQTPQIETEWGTPKLDGVELLRYALNGSEPRITYVVDGQTVFDADATNAARAMVQRIRQQFQSWLRTTEAVVEGVPVRQLVEDRYNEVNNAMVAADYDGSYLALPGLSNVVHKTKHRLAVVARILQEGYAVMAHGVGSGKTFSQIVAAMEMRRLGLAKKPMIVVQKATIGQFAASFRAAYPDARVLVADEKSFSARHRRRFMSKIALGDFDAIVLTQPQFDRLPNKAESVRAYFQDLIDELEDAIRGSRSQEGKGSPTVKELEKAKRALEAKLARQLQAMEKYQDQTVFFENLGVDFLLVDEAHAYKKIPIVTRKVRVRGIPSESSQRAIGLEMKVRHVQEKNGGRGVVAATGTPVTNSMAESYVMLKITAPHLLAEYNIRNFDDFANTFGETQSKLEFGWGGSWKMATRFNRFINGPELVTMIRSAFDVRMGNKELGLKVPELRGGEPEMLVAPQTPPMAQINRFIERVAQQYDATADKREVSWVPIVTMQVGMAAALDPRLFDPSMPDHPESKVNTAVRRIVAIHRSSTDVRGTQLVFADRFKPMDASKLTGFLGGGASDLDLDMDEDLDAEPRADQADEDGEGRDREAEARSAAEEAAYSAGGFNLYHDLRDKLVAAGIPASEIAIVHDYNNDKKREKLFEAVNAGRVRVLIGSTEKMGVGVNVQKRLAALHHLDPPRMMTPAMMEQRNGRGIRQGNENKTIDVIMYGVEKSMDTGIYQMLEAKGRFIAQLLAGKGVGREFEDPADEITMSMQEMTAKLTGDPRVLRKVELDSRVRELQAEQSAFERTKGANIDKRRGYERRVERFKQTTLPRLEEDGRLLAEAFADGHGWDAIVDGQRYTERNDIAAAIDRVYQKQSAALAGGEGKQAETSINVNGLRVALYTRVYFGGRLSRSVQVLHGDRADREVQDGAGALASIAARARNFPGYLASVKRDAERDEAQIPALIKAIASPWDKQGELDTALEELRAIEASLSGADRQGTVSVGEQADAEFESEADRVQAATLPRLPGSKGSTRVGPGRASAAAQRQPETKAGGKLVLAIKADPEGRKVGMRSIVAMLVDLVGAQLRVGREQLNRRQIGSYQEGSHVVRSMTGAWQIDVHEVGHALAALLNEASPGWMKGLGVRLVELAGVPGSFASAESAEEGFGEWVRRFVVDPASIPNELTNRLEALLDRVLPDVAKGLRDAHRALQAHQQRSTAAQLRSYMSDRPALPKIGATLRHLWDTLLFKVFSAEAALERRVRVPIFNALRSVSLKLAQRYERQLEGAAADYRTAYQNRLAVPRETARALWGPESGQGQKGLRVLVTAGALDRATATAGTAEQLQLMTAFDLAKLQATGVRDGDWLYLTDYTIADVVEAVGRKDWEAFEVYGWAKTALERYEKDGQRYPGLVDGLTPGVLKQEIARLDREHPGFLKQYDRVNRYMDQLLLASLLSGEFTVQQVLRIVGKWESYWPLPRETGLRVEPGRAATPGAGVRARTDPTSGVERAFGSDAPFMSILQAVERRTRMALEAYYSNRVMQAVLSAIDRVASLDVPLQVKAQAKRILSPLQLDWKKVAELSPEEKRQAIAEYLNEQAAQAANTTVDQLPPTARIEPDDVMLAEPGQPIAVWRQVRPRAVRVIGPNVDGERRYYQVDDPLLYEFFARANAPNATLKWASDLVNGVNASRRRALTQNIVFAIRSVPRDVASSVLLGEGRERFFPGVYLLAGVFNRLTGQFPDAREVGELYSRAAAAVEGPRHRGVVRRFLAAMAEGVLVDGYTRLTWSDRAKLLPGQSVAAAMKPIELVNFLTGGRQLSQLMESLPREGAYALARRRGATPALARARGDRVTGNFSARVGSANVANAYRMGLFLNAAMQINWQILRGLSDVDPKKRAENWLALGWLGVLGGMAAAAAYLLLDDDDVEELRERPANDRMGFMAVKIPGTGEFVRLPHDYGPPGAFTSMGYNLVESHLIGQGVKGRTAAWEFLKRAQSIPQVTELLSPDVRLALELQTNYSLFFGEPIVPGYLQAAPAEQQVRGTTPEWARAVGRALDVSPMKVEYALSQAFTAQANAALTTMERVAGGKKITDAGAGGVPGFGRLFLREPTGWRARSVQELSDMDDQYKALRARRKALAGGGATPEQLAALDRDMAKVAGAYARMKAVRGTYDLIKRERRKTSPDQARVRALESRMVELAQKYLQGQ